MRRITPLVLVPIVAITFLVQSTAMAFNWNGKTALHELDVLFGNMKTVSGHPLATHNAFREAVKRAQGNATTTGALMRVLREDTATLIESDSDAMQTVLFGNWLNEIRTNIDAEGSLALSLAAKLLRARYRKYLDGRVHSDRWQEDTRYSSSNYQHSMMVTSTDPNMQIDQDEVFDVIEEYVHWALASAILNLAIATKGREDSSMSADDSDLSWVSGLRLVGSVFHVFEDSSVACTEEAKQALVARDRHCVVGDGHGIVKTTASGGRKVVTLSDNSFYDRKVADGSKPHAELDDLYRAELIGKVYGTFDPAMANADVLLGVVEAASEIVDATAGIPLFSADGTANDQWDAMAFSISSGAAQDIRAKVMVPRYAKKDERLPLPPLPGADGEDKSDGLGEKDDATGCSVGSDPNAAAVPVILLLVGAGLRRRFRQRRP